MTFLGVSVYLSDTSPISYKFSSSTVFLFQMLILKVILFSINIA